MTMDSSRELKNSHGMRFPEYRREFKIDNSDISGLFNYFGKFTINEYQSRKHCVNFCELHNFTLNGKSCVVRALN